jgi:hypothetical protein
MEFVRKDFDKCLINPFLKFDAELKAEIEKLKLYPELTRSIVKSSEGVKLDFNRLVCYICYMYDINSPLRSVKDVNERRLESIRLAGFEFDIKGKLPKEIEEVVFCQNTKVNSMIIRYALCHHDNGTRYSKLVAFQIKYQRLLEELIDETRTMEEKKVEKNKSLIENINLIEQEINEIMSLIVGGDIIPQLMYSFYRMLDEDRLGIFPEEIAQRKKDGLPGVEVNFFDIALPE